MLRIVLAEAGARRLHGLTDRLVDLARLKAGLLDLLHRAEDLAGPMEAFLDELRPDFDAAGLSLVQAIPMGLLKALCDPARARQVLRHLLDNALP